MIDFKLEKGMFVRLRNGEKAEVLKTDCGGEHPVLIILCSVGNIMWRRIDGKYEDNECDFDIVGIWEEPRPKKVCYINKSSGLLYMMPENINKFTIDRELERFPCALDEV